MTQLYTNLLPPVPLLPTVITKPEFAGNSGLRERKFNKARNAKQVYKITVPDQQMSYYSGQSRLRLGFLVRRAVLLGR